MKIFTPLLFILYATVALAQSDSEEFTASGNFTVPAGVSEIFVELIGAGGSGGYNGTGGGGGGGYASSYISVMPGDVYPIIIGAPDLGLEVGSTRFGEFFYATGGENGVSVPNPEIGGGGNSGIGVGGNVANYAGGKGGGGYYTYFGGGGGGAAGAAGIGGDGGNTIAWTGICLTPGGDGGIGAGGPSGNGGKGAGFIDAICALSDPAGAGNNFGGGGGGGNGNGGLPGGGAGGYCKITWCAVDVDIAVEETTLTAHATDVTYQWIDCTTGGNITDATNQTYTATVSGSYAVIISDGLCSDTSFCVDIEIEIIDINDYYAQIIQVAPNPFENSLTLSGLPNQDFQFTVLNAMGQIVWTGNKLLTDYSFLSSGVYILRIYNDNLDINKMVIKK